MPLSAANVIQAKTSSALNLATASVALDSGTQAGSTITVELYGGGVPILDGGLGGRVPNGFELDAVSEANGARMQYMFRKRDVTAGEGFTGGSPPSWDFSFSAANNWIWRVTEWDQGLEPVSPLERTATNFATSTGPTTLSTGTTDTTNRADVVGLAYHHWHRGSQSAQSMTWSNHTNGFTKRDEQRLSLNTSPIFAEYGECWSWLFSPSAVAFETTATINLASRSTEDVYSALLVVYAATTYG